MLGYQSHTPIKESSDLFLINVFPLCLIKAFQFGRKRFSSVTVNHCILHFLDPDSKCLTVNRPVYVCSQLTTDA